MGGLEAALSAPGCPTGPAGTFPATIEMEEALPAFLVFLLSCVPSVATVEVDLRKPASRKDYSDRRPTTPRSQIRGVGGNWTAGTPTTTDEKQERRKEGTQEAWSLSRTGSPIHGEARRPARHGGDRSPDAREPEGAAPIDNPTAPQLQEEPGPGSPQPPAAPSTSATARRISSWAS
jgi:hypothetical protein